MKDVKDGEDVKKRERQRERKRKRKRRGRVGQEERILSC